MEVIRTRNEAEGLELDAHTATPGWLGERLDVGYALDAAPTSEQWLTESVNRSETPGAE